MLRVHGHILEPPQTAKTLERIEDRVMKVLDTFKPLSIFNMENKKMVYQAI